MTDGEVLLSERRGGVLVVTLNRPEKLNAWNRAMEHAYFAALTAGAADPDVRSIVVTGAGRGFCAGADLSDASLTGSSRTGPRRTYRHWYPLTIPKPVIAAVNGPAAGIGMLLALMADIRVIDPAAYLLAAYSHRGLPAEHGTSWMLPRLVGHGRAFEILATDRRIPAAECAEIGLATSVSVQGQALETAVALAADLASRPGQSIQLLKAQLFHDATSTLRQADLLAEDLLAAVADSPDFQESVAAFREKRDPRFEGPSPFDDGRAASHRLPSAP